MLAVATKLTTMVSLATFKQWLGKRSNLTKTISSLTSSGTVATATCAAHGYSTNDFVLIAGSVDSSYNGSFLINVTGANTFTYTLPYPATSPATGSPTVTPDDGRYVTMIDGASAEIESYLGLIFVKRTVSERFSGDDKTVRVLKYTPVVSINTFTIDDLDISEDDYELDLETGIVEFLAGEFTLGVKNVYLEYTAGYDVQDGSALPRDIVRATLDLGKAIHDELVSNTIAATTVSLGPSSMVVKASDYPPSVKRVLRRWEGSAFRP